MIRRPDQWPAGRPAASDLSQLFWARHQLSIIDAKADTAWSVTVRTRGGGSIVGPYGYLLDPTTHRLVPHPDEQHTVREIFTLYAGTRLGTRAIAKRLNAQGKRTRAGKPWSGLTIGRMLANRLYLGEVGFRDVTTPTPTSH